MMRPQMKTSFGVHTYGIDFCRIHPPSSRVSRCAVQSHAARQEMHSWFVPHGITPLLDEISVSSEFFQPL